MSNQYKTFSTLAKNSDIVVAHNAIPQGAGGVAARLHMQPSDIGVIAAETNPGKLVLSHRMNRSLGKETQTEAEIRKHYDGDIIFADDLDVIQPAKPLNALSKTKKGAICAFSFYSHDRLKLPCSFTGLFSPAAVTAFPADIRNQ